ncbi:hypothetical protein HMPREF0972_01961 [Actinomyces sp. oral taxon 848 str. F0332]|nr:hypothetical protein HMPREF0972_01961 [Actinomyces sp. oral taxon 848 str. F0332]
MARRVRPQEGARGGELLPLQRRGPCGGRSALRQAPKRRSKPGPAQPSGCVI